MTFRNMKCVWHLTCKILPKKDLDFLSRWLILILGISYPYFKFRNSKHLARLTIGQIGINKCRRILKRNYNHLLEAKFNDRSKKINDRRNALKIA